jgi:hypothetical protein
MVEFSDFPNKFQIASISALEVGEWDCQVMNPSYMMLYINCPLMRKVSHYQYNPCSIMRLLK